MPEQWRLQMPDGSTTGQKMPARTLRNIVSDVVWSWQHSHAVTLGVREQDALVDLLVTRVGELLVEQKETGHHE